MSEPKALFPEALAPYVVTVFMHVPPAARRPDALRHIAESLPSYANSEQPLNWLDGRLEWRFQVAGLTSVEQGLLNESK